MTTYGSYTDLELAALLRGGDQYAFSEIYDRYMPLLLRHAVDMLHDEDQAQDVVQDIFQMLWEKAGELEIHTSFSAFLYKATRFRVLKQIRHSKIASQYTELVKTEFEKGVASTDEAIDEKELAFKIEKGLAKLPAKMREVFELSRMQDLSHKEIAKQLHLSDHTVKRQVSNALKIMRESLNKGLSLFI
ncbi:RNA polymerase sigma factor [Pedobacter heparinus]|uniref:RNA polymerase sigma-70 factor n=1 Tax=Pedobacter heparinus (strain ATCC 13125 / DSM 2366 / CIP 104194 / JCM 7457 / NBRC 12017 / NCIMB 9290 / NRRL B-14731 / HIM 762-3) TaxID=485917 RepID=C6Y3B4_PEDHD|nr:RNA polymerase sigma-70 factor [Pedobacter heparinus]ACU05339.1 RNA polymerase sigma-70 factor [Pedobacter heparinus DSM 2366]